MNQLVATAIILSRTNYGEADRILTVITPEYGKLRLLAKGVRRVKSKLAGGIELFSTSEITFIKGRGEIGTLVSARLGNFYSHIAKHLDRTMLGYGLIKLLHKATEDEAEPEYFEALKQAFEALDNPAIPLVLIKCWFAAQLLRLGGHTPNLQFDTDGKPLEATETYSFDFDSIALAPSPRGQLHAAEIKFLRLLFAGTQPKVLAAVQGNEGLLTKIAPLVEALLKTHAGL